ncbi:MAG: hypothetical protein JXQ75_17160 [Phycisphaerae bacterium]|nr:hypothetical protein [Phycisphaerae bacterium]
MRLTADDAIIGPDGRTTLVAHIEPSHGLRLFRDHDDIEIRFFLGRELVGTALTNDSGCATLECRRSLAAVDGYQAEADVPDCELRAPGRTYVWDGDRTAVAVDIDNTICHTDRDHLLFRATDRNSKPIAGSVQTLSAISHDFDIIYLTARPHPMLDKTRQWLAAHGFPDGPLITAPDWRSALRQQRYKRHALQRLRRYLPNLLIGIGDREADVEAYVANDMLAIRIRDDHRAADHPSLVFRTWDEIGAVFTAHRAFLADPERLDRSLKNGMIRDDIARPPGSPPPASPIPPD